MRLSMHQPNFLPWLGYFHKIAQTDVFVILDSVQFPRGRSVANRNVIKTPTGETRLTVPLSKPKGHEGKVTYRDVSFAERDWFKKTLRTIRLAYGKSNHFERFYPVIEEVLAQPDFCEMNIAFIRHMLDAFGIGTRIAILSELDLPPNRKNDLILALCQHFNANVYLSGRGAAAYNDESFLSANGVQLSYQEFEPREYPQLHGDFIACLSAIDWLFNMGDDSSFVEW